MIFFEMEDFGLDKDVEIWIYNLNSHIKIIQIFLTFLLHVIILDVEKKLLYNFIFTLFIEPYFSYHVPEFENYNFFLSTWSL